MQHYGVPTHYVDFTTEPEIAGFFAAVDRGAKLNEQGCITCVDPDEVVEYLLYVAEAAGWEKDSWPEKVEVSVDDLWRMQAQSGHFLYWPREGIEHYYGLDRIIFTHDGSLYTIPEERIYPTRKNALELRLDEFITMSLMLDNQRSSRKMFEELKRRGIIIDRAETEAPEQNDYLKPGSELHNSWRNVGKEWRSLELPGEDYHAAEREAINAAVPFSSNTPSTEIEATARRGFKRTIEEHPACRAKLLKWTLLGEEVDPPSGWRTETCARLERVWDGMRRLPYTDEQLAAALAATLRMIL